MTKINIDNSEANDLDNPKYLSKSLMRDMADSDLSLYDDDEDTLEFNSYDVSLE